MCNLFGGGQSASQQTTPTYVPPAQTAVSGTSVPITSGTVKGDNRSGAGVNSRVRANSADSDTAARRRRSASSGLGL